MANEIKDEELIFFVFGLTKKDLDNEEVVIRACINKAYRDMCRTIRFVYSQSDYADLDTSEKKNI